LQSLSLFGKAIAMSLNAPLLPAIGLVSNLQQEDRDALSSYGTFHIAQPGAVLIEQDVSHGNLYCIISGTLHALRNDAGNEIVLGRILAGEWVGEVDLFDPSSAVCSVVAVEPTQYWVITREELEEFLNNYTSAGTLLLIGLATTLSRRIRDVTRKLSEQTELTKLQASLYNMAEDK
jgi:CRP/FNR family cyclic AMP-dependent transcriptional regulator